MDHAQIYMNDYDNHYRHKALSASTPTDKAFRPSGHTNTLTVFTESASI